MKSTRQIKFYQIVILLILFSIISACKDRDDTEKAPIPSVVVAPVVKQSVIQSMNIVGQVVAKESVYLRARVTGFLEKRNFIEGSFVRKNDLLFQIEKPEYEAQVEAAEANLDTAKANLENDTVDYNRQKYLATKDAISQRIYDKAVAQKAISEAGVLSAKAKLKEAKLNLSYTDIKTPFNGRIGLAKYSVGNVVGPESNPLAHVVMIDPIQIEFNLSESLVTTLLQERFHNKAPDPKSKKGPTATEVIPKITLSNGTIYPKDGKIDFIDNMINSMTGTIKMRAIFENPKSILVPGAYVTVKLQDKDKVEALLIPQASIQEDQAGKFVMLLNKDNEVNKQSITTGSIYGINIVVKSGLKLGELVIKEGLQKVRGGIKVNPVTDKEIEQSDTTPTAKEKADSLSKAVPTEKDKKAEKTSTNKSSVKTENKEKQPKQNQG
jgi:membrane fusion protein, multidrug efflux system